MPGDFRSRAIQQENPAIEIGGQQTAAHGFDDVLVERLKVLEFFALLLQFDALCANGAGQKTPQIRDGQESEEIYGEPGFQRREAAGIETAVRGISP